MPSYHLHISQLTRKGLYQKCVYLCVCMMHRPGMWRKSILRRQWTFLMMGVITVFVVPFTTTFASQLLHAHTQWWSWSSYNIVIIVMITFLCSSSWFLPTLFCKQEVNFCRLCWMGCVFALVVVIILWKGNHKLVPGASGNQNQRKTI